MKDKDYDIFDAGFDKFLHKGPDMPIADLQRPLPEQKKPDSQREMNPSIINKAQYKNSILYFANKEIDFNNKPNQKELLETLFKKPTKNWFYDEVQEDWDETEIDINKYPKNFWRKFYGAGDDINTFVALEAVIKKDFIIKDASPKGNIRINPKYV